jgi:hypothetical protein
MEIIRTDLVILLNLRLQNIHNMKFYRFILILLVFLIAVSIVFAADNPPPPSLGDDAGNEQEQTPNEQAIETIGTDTGLGPDASVAGGTTGDGTVTASSIEGQVGEDGLPLEITDGTVQTGENPCGESEKHQLQF